MCYPRYSLSKVEDRPSDGAITKLVRQTRVTTNSVPLMTHPSTLHRHMPRSLIALFSYCRTPDEAATKLQMLSLRHDPTGNRTSRPTMSVADFPTTLPLEQLPMGADL